jgi:hypothetical protein
VKKTLIGFGLILLLVVGMVAYGQGIQSEDSFRDLSSIDQIALPMKEQCLKSKAGSISYFLVWRSHDPLQFFSLQF